MKVLIFPSTGLAKSDKITRRILNVYKSSNESLLSVLLKELIHSHNSTETRSAATQTKCPQQELNDVSLISTKSKSKKSRRKKNHGLVNQEFRMRKSKKLKEVSTISHNLEQMSSNISIITNKLDDFKRNPTQDESKTIIGHVGTIMNQLNGCINNFENLCQNIKQINETRNQNYDEWMDDLKNSENGRRFLRKLQKSFSRVMNEEKSKVQRDYRLKLEREKMKLTKLYRSRPVERKQDPSSTYADTIGKEINEIFQSTCMMIKNVEKENELFEKALDLEMKTKAERPKKSTCNIKAERHINLNECRQIHSAESRSSTSSSSKSFEKKGSNDEN